MQLADCVRVEEQGANQLRAGQTVQDVKIMCVASLNHQTLQTFWIPS